MDASTMSISQESQHSLKRDHDSFAFDDLANLEKPFTVDSEFNKYESQPEETEERESSIPTPPISIENNQREPSPTQSRRSSTSSLTDAASATPSLRAASPPMLSSSAPTQASPSKSAFAVMNGNGNAPPLAKRAKLTFAEKEMKRLNKEFKDQEKAAEKAKKEAERAAQAEEKARRDAEKETERKKREAEKEEKRVALEAEKAAKEERKRKKDEEKRLKEEEKLRLEEEKKKKERSQKTLNSFFAKPAGTARRNSVEGRRSMSPAPTNLGLPATVDSPAATTPGKKQASTYEKIFLDFFVQDHVTMAPINRFERDEEASETLQNTIDSYILGNRSPNRQNSFDSMSLFHLSSHDNIPRGKRCMPVREIMAEITGDSSRPIDLTTDSQNSQIKRTGDLLRKIPMKFLKFQEDVRPPYRGTYTSRPVHGIAKLARNPLRRDLPNTNYDYDSEGEWVEDEDAEDLNSEGEEEDIEPGEHDEDMDGFLDDEGDETANSRRLVLQGDIEPVSTGLCWEDRHKKSTNVKMMPYRMEMILDPKLKSINPFSNEYWPIPVSKQKMEPPRVPLNAIKSNSLNGSAANIKATKPFFTPVSELLKADPSQPHNSTQASSSTSLKTSSKPDKPKKLLPQEDMPSFLDAVRGSDLSKVGLIEVLKKKFTGRTAGQIKATLETCAKRVGQKEADKRWVLNDDAPAASTVASS